MSYYNVAQQTKYTLCEKNIPVIDKGVVIRITGEMIVNKNLKASIDRRLLLCSLNNDNSFEEYMRYLKLYLSSVEDYIINTPTNQNNTIYTYLSLGYLPVWVPPTFMSREIGLSLIRRIRESGDGYIEADTYKTDGAIIADTSKDIFVNRMDMAKQLKCEPNDVKISHYINLMKGV